MENLLKTIPKKATNGWVGGWRPDSSSWPSLVYKVTVFGWFPMCWFGNATRIQIDLSCEETQQFLHAIHMLYKPRFFIQVDETTYGDFTYPIETCRVFCSPPIVWSGRWFLPHRKWWRASITRHGGCFAWNGTEGILRPSNQIWRECSQNACFMQVWNGCVCACLFVQALI